MCAAYKKGVTGFVRRMAVSASDASSLCGRLELRAHPSHGLASGYSRLIVRGEGLNPYIGLVIGKLPPEFFGQVS
jgi:hypothetical protein